MLQVGCVVVARVWADALPLPTAHFYGSLPLPVWEQILCSRECAISKLIFPTKNTNRDRVAD